MIRKALRKFLGIPAPEVIPVLYFDDIYLDTPLEFNGDWVDVRACTTVKYFNPSDLSWNVMSVEYDEDGKQYVDLYPNELVKIPLGFALKLPQGYEAILEVRSSTSKNTGILKATSGVIDEFYCGNSDQWFFVGYTTRHARLYIGERIAQFRIQKKQPELEFKPVGSLSNLNRGGHGSTGRF